MHVIPVRFVATVCGSILALAATVSRAEDAPAPAVDAPATPQAPAPPAATPPPPSGIIPKPGAPDPKPFTLLARYFDAAQRGDLAAVKLCVDKGVDAKARDEVGRSAFALAVRDGRSLEVAEYVAGLGVPTDEPDAVGRSPLHEAAGNGDTKIVKWLLARGAKVDRKDMQGRTPLQNAVLGGSREIASLLIDAGADVSVHDNFGDTPLIQACNKGLDELAKLLVEKGADVSAKDQEGRTAAERAEETAPYCRSLAKGKPAA
jgi:ankyrin repeat protein